MTIHLEPLYSIAYADSDTAMTDIAGVTQQAATTIAAALARGGIAPPDATTQAQLAARITALESTLTGWYGSWVTILKAELDSNGWVALGSGYVPVRYRKEGPKTVRVQGGLTKPGTVVNDQIILTLPAGFRPEYVTPGRASIGPDVSRQMSVSTDGTVRIQMPATAAIGYALFDFTFPIP